MRGIELDTLYRPAEKQRALRDYKIEVQRGLGLGVNVSLDIPYSLRDDLVREVATNILDVSSDLKIPLPHIGLISPSEEARLISLSRSSDRYPLATTKITPEHPEGVLEFSPTYLEHLVRFEMNREAEPPPRPHEWVEAHEGFHLWQHGDKLGAEIIALHCALFEKEGWAAWEYSPPEVLANDYADRWLLKLFAAKVFKPYEV